jgi:hypothetical protein
MVFKEVIFGKWANSINFSYSVISDKGIITALQGYELDLHVYGFGLTNDSEIKLSSFPSTPGHICKSDILHVQTRFEKVYFRLGWS